MWLGKRLFDLFFAALGLIILSPFFIIIALLIKKDSQGPVFFRQKRVGRNEVPFYIHKFRTMRPLAEQQGLKITVGNDSRITKIGEFLRKLKLDELPQLIDVVQGTMSLVGPRPEVPEYVAKYPEEKRKAIFQLRPGITDLASIKFKDENTILAKAKDPEQAYINEILPIKIGYYMDYRSRSSLTLDLQIIFMTISEIFGKRA